MNQAEPMGGTGAKGPPVIPVIGLIAAGLGNLIVLLVVVYLFSTALILGAKSMRPMLETAAILLLSVCLLLVNVPLCMIGIIQRGRRRMAIAALVLSLTPQFLFVRLCLILSEILGIYIGE